MIAAGVPAAFARIPGRARLWAAAALSIAPLHMYWSATSGILYPGYTSYGDCGYTSNYYCTPDVFIPGSYQPGQTVTVVQTELRLFLVIAAVAFAVAALAGRTASTRTLVRAATLAIGWAFFVGLAHGSADVAVLAGVVLALTVPLVWSRPGRGEHRPAVTARARGAAPAGRGVLARREFAG